MTTSHKFVRHVGSVSLATLFSRILGYARDALVAYAFGGGFYTDVFYAAFRLPNLFRRIFGEGSMTAAFVPIFSEHLSHERRAEAVESFQAIFTVLLSLLLALVTAGIVFAPTFTHLVAWGFKSDPEKFAMTVRLTRLTFPFLLFVSLAALNSGALNSLGHFFLPSFAPSMLSVAEILFVLLFAKRFEDPLQGLAASAVVGGILHFGIMVPLLRREGVPPRWNWKPRHPDLLRVGRAIIPAVWGMSVDQINAFVDTVCASFLVQGSVTALYNSNRLMQFPLALFGIAMSTAALPALSSSAAKQDWKQMKDTLNLSIRLVFFTVVPAMVGLVVLGLPSIELLFEHGRFTHEASLLTNSALIFYSLGLPAFSAVKVLASSFYALKDMKTPVRVASLCLLINIGGNLLLMWKWGVAGLALASTLSSSANALILFWMLRKRLGLLGGRRMFQTLFQSAGASALMAAAAAAIVYLPEGRLLWKVPLGVAVSVALYLGIARLLKMEELGHLSGLFSRRAETPVA